MNEFEPSVGSMKPWHSDTDRKFIMLYEEKYRDSLCDLVNTSDLTEVSKIAMLGILNRDVGYKTNKVREDFWYFKKSEILDVLKQAKIRGENEEDLETVKDFLFSEIDRLFKETSSD